MKRTGISHGDALGPAGIGRGLSRAALTASARRRRPDPRGRDHATEVAAFVIHDLTTGAEHPDDPSRSSPSAPSRTSPRARRPPLTRATPFRPGFTGLRCRACGEPAPEGPVFVCTRCFGPLEATYDLDGLRGRLDRESPRRARRHDLALRRAAAGLDAAARAACASACRRSSPAPRLAARLGLERLWVKDDSRNPTLSFKDRVVGVAAARAAEFGFHTLACASTGNLSASVAAAAAARGLRAVVFIPADLEPAKVAQARALGATVVRVDGPYDDVNRLCLELTDELEGWAVLNVNLRPYYAEGSKTIAFEIAQQLGWRTPDVVVAPLASGSLYTKLAAGFGELVAVGLLDEAPIRYVGGQAAGCAPIANAFEAGDGRRPPGRATGHASCARWPSARPPTAATAVRLARQSGGAILGVPDDATIAAIRLLAETRGHLHRDRRRRDAGARCAVRSTRAACAATTRSCSSSPATASRRSTCSTTTSSRCPSRSRRPSTRSRRGGRRR